MLGVVLGDVRLACSCSLVESHAVSSCTGVTSRGGFGTLRLFSQQTVANFHSLASGQVLSGEKSSSASAVTIVTTTKFELNLTYRVDDSFL